MAAAPAAHSPPAPLRRPAVLARPETAPRRAGPTAPGRKVPQTGPAARARPVPACPTAPAGMAPHQGRQSKIVAKTCTWNSTSCGEDPPRKKSVVGAQGPAPVQGLVAVPGRRLASADGGVVGQRGHGLIVRHAGGRDPGNARWHRPPPARDVDDGVAAGLAEASGGAGHAGECPQARRHARAIPRLRRAGSLGCARPPPAAPGALRHEARRAGHRARWQRDHVVGVGRRQRPPRAVAAATGTGGQQGPYKGRFFENEMR